MFLGQLAAMLERRRLTAPAAAATGEAGSTASVQGRLPGRGWPIAITRLSAVAAARKVLAQRFTLTGSQERVLSDILADLAGPAAMMRLLQGDVGCGKTVVALLVMLAASGSGAAVTDAVITT